MNPDKKIRRLQSLLYTSGVGCILFSLWSGIRGIEFAYTFTHQAVPSSDGVIMDESLTTIVGIVIFVTVFISIAWNLYIGRKAILASLNKKTGNLYIVLAIFVLLTSVISYLSDFVTRPPLEWFQTDDIIMAMINLTSNIILAEVIVYSILLKKMR